MRSCGATCGCAVLATLVADLSPALARHGGEPTAGEDAYAYPVRPGTPAWGALASHEEMIAATRIPEELLVAMSTDGLLQTVLDHPLFLDVLASASLERGLEALVLTADGFAELLTRSDVGPAMLRRYRATELPGPGSSAAVMALVKLELLLSHPAVLATLGADELRELQVHALRLARGKAASPELFGALSLERTVVLAGRVRELQTAAAGWSAPAAASEFLTAGWRAGTHAPAPDRSDAPTGALLAVAWHAGVDGAAEVHAPAGGHDPMPDAGEAAASRIRAPATIRTPMGSLVPEARTLVAGDLSAAERQGCAEEWAAAYPRAVVEGECTYRYNCHSFAWHRADPSNDVWIGMPGGPASAAHAVYWTDGSYALVATASYIPSDVRPGARVAYLHADHSAVVVSPSELLSKWHHAPLMRHPPAYGPYDASGLAFYACSTPGGCNDAQCAPGARETAACAECGARTRTCNRWGYWDAWQACSGADCR